MEAQDRELPAYIQKEFDDFLKCGRLEHGFLRVRCDSCHVEHLAEGGPVAFSCKRRSFYGRPPRPSCGARRMKESAAVLVDDPHKGLRFVRVKGPSHEELAALVGTIARRVGRKLERQGLLERDIAYGYLSAEAVDDDPLAQLQGRSISYRIAVGTWPAAPRLAAPPPSASPIRVFGGFHFIGVRSVVTCRSALDP